MFSPLYESASGDHYRESLSAFLIRNAQCVIVYAWFELMSFSERFCVSGNDVVVCCQSTQNARFEWKVTT